MNIGNQKTYMQVLHKSCEFFLLKKLVDHYIEEHIYTKKIKLYLELSLQLKLETETNRFRSFFIVHLSAFTAEIPGEHPNFVQSCDLNSYFWCEDKVLGIYLVSLKILLTAMQLPIYDTKVTP